MFSWQRSLAAVVLHPHCLPSRLFVIIELSVHERDERASSQLGRRKKMLIELLIPRAVFFAWSINCTLTTDIFMKNVQHLQKIFSQIFCLLRFRCRCLPQSSVEHLQNGSGGSVTNSSNSKKKKRAVGWQTLPINLIEEGRKAVS